MKYEEINGDLIELALQDKFNVIAHGCNCFCTQKSGIAKQIPNLEVIKLF
jgi:O-acetyl-ADP-ribose deacetylase (regulator of RNase III)